MQSNELTPQPGTASTPKRGLRGFAAMDPQRQREIASEGGKASHQNDEAGGSESSSAEPGSTVTSTSTDDARATTA